MCADTDGIAEAESRVPLPEELRDHALVDSPLQEEHLGRPVAEELLQGGATPRKDWVRHFSVLGTLRMPIGEGSVVCLCKERLPLDGTNSAIPAGLL
jgi:hypothetical protein